MQRNSLKLVLTEVLCWEQVSRAGLAQVGVLFVLIVVLRIWRQTLKGVWISFAPGVLLFMSMNVDCDLGHRCWLYHSQPACTVENSEPHLQMFVVGVCCKFSR